ncbi:MAG: sugar dehydrogenase, partial [Streptomycetaceae bacterium]|nr:sugar dehydrogenase [Streptomycetaceae bacterium]
MPGGVKINTHRRVRARRSARRTLIAIAIVISIAATLLSYNLTRKSEAATTLPSGFSIRQTPSGQAAWTLTDIEYTPDGGYFTTGKAGHVAWVSPTGDVVPVADLDVQTDVDLGLTGISVAPDYATSRNVFVVRTTSTGKLRASEFHVEGTTTPTGFGPEKIVLEADRRSEAHAISGVIAAPDGTLWISVGDNSDFRQMDPTSLIVQDPNVIYGKLLHVTPDGNGVPTNPKYSAAAPASWPSRTYATGFRSPFRMSLDPVSGAPMVGDVGWFTWEEVNLVQAGGNYGWPCWEGDGMTVAFDQMAECQKGYEHNKPLYTYNHNGQGSSVTGGVVYTGSGYPAQYRGLYFFGDYSQQWIKTMQLRDANGG